MLIVQNLEFELVCFNEQVNNIAPVILGYFPEMEVQNYKLGIDMLSS